MIDEDEIAKFPLSKQMEIRAEIALLIKNGRPRKYLILSKLGTVLYDTEAVTLDAIGEALKRG